MNGLTPLSACYSLKQLLELDRPGVPPLIKLLKYCLTFSYQSRCNIIEHNTATNPRVWIYLIIASVYEAVIIWLVLSLSLTIRLNYSSTAPTIEVEA